MKNMPLFLYIVLYALAIGFGTSKAYAEDVADVAIKPAATAVASLKGSETIPTDIVEKPENTGNNDVRVSLDFKDAEITNVLRILSLKSGVNIVAGPEVKGPVTIRLVDVNWEKALEVVLRTYGYVFERDGDVIRVTTREKIADEDLVTHTYVLNYITADEVSAAVREMLSERGRIKAVPRANTVIATDVASNLYKIESVVKRLDKPTPQAYIDSRIVRTELGQSENLGIDWNVAGGLASGAARPTTFPFATDTKRRQDKGGTELAQFFPFVSSSVNGMTGATQTTANGLDPRAFPLPAPAVSNETFAFGRMDFSSFSAVLQLLKSRTNTKIVSNPRIVVLNNQTAKIQIGDQVPLPTFERNETTGSFEVTGFTYRDTGVVLDVTPHINNADEILVDLKPEVTNEGTLLQFTTNLAAPRFNVTQAQTQVLIRSGETIAIGGLLTDNVSTTVDKVPFLGNIPLIGKVFRSKRQTPGGSNNKIETLFFVTVKIIDTEGQTLRQVVTSTV